MFTCTALDEGNNPWMLFEFPEMTLVSEIVLKAQHYVADHHMPNENTHILLGTNLVTPGDFSGFHLVGKFANPTLDEFRSFRVSPSMNAKYLAIQQTDKRYLTLCFAEVFE